jgi:flagellar protein FliL
MANEPMNEPNQDNDTSPSASKKWRSGIISAVLIVPIATCASWFLLHRSASGRPSKKVEPKVKAVMHLDPFVVNLTDPEGDRFLRVGIDLGLAREIDERSHPSQGAMALARTRDTILSILTSWDAQSLLAPAGKATLKDQLTKALRERAPEMGVLEVYFTEFLVQR